MHKLHERGDTIVEVMIAVAIATMMLAAAYALTSRNTQINQEVQEQAYAQKLVEEQVELLRSYGGVPDGETIGGCFVGGSYSSDDSQCDLQNGGATYTTSITSSAASIYEVATTWDTIGGSTANVTVYYRAE